MEGRIVRWNDDRGFGFISCDQSKQDVFAHISEFKKGYRRPKVGDRVRFTAKSERGKTSAISIRLINVAPNKSSVRSIILNVVGLILFSVVAVVMYFTVIKPRLVPEYVNSAFECQGKHWCSEMLSCEEAQFYLDNCPGVNIDGDGDGVPCESQHCKNDWL